MCTFLRVFEKIISTVSRFTSKKKDVDLKARAVPSFRSLSLKESRLHRSGEIPAILGIEAGAISTSKSISEERNGENGDATVEWQMSREVLVTARVEGVVH